MCHILHNEQKIKRHVEGVKGVKHCTLIPIKDQKAMQVGGVESAYRSSIQSNVTHFEGVKSSSIYTIRAVMLCMSKVLKEVQNGLTHLYL